MENISISAACACGQGRPRTEQITALQQPSIACQLLLLTAEPRAGFSYLHTAGFWGRPLWNVCASSLVSHAERQEQLCFTLQSAKQMKNERVLHRLIQTLMLFRQHSALGRGRQNESVYAPSSQKSNHKWWNACPSAALFFSAVLNKDPVCLSLFSSLFFFPVCVVQWIHCKILAP